MMAASAMPFLVTLLLMMAGKPALEIPLRAAKGLTTKFLLSLRMTEL